MFKAWKSSLWLKRPASDRKDIWLRSRQVHTGRTCNHSLRDTWLCRTRNFRGKRLWERGGLLECRSYSLHFVNRRSLIIYIDYAAFRHSTRIITQSCSKWSRHAPTTSHHPSGTTCQRPQRTWSGLSWWLTLTNAWLPSRFSLTHGCTERTLPFTH